MAVTYVLKATASDLTASPAGAFNVEASEGAATASTLSSGSLAAATSADGHAFTVAGNPAASGTSTGAFTVLVEVTTGQTDFTIQVQLARVNSGGTEQAASGFTATQAATAGTKTFSGGVLTNPGLGTWAAGDRLRVDIRFVRAAGGHGNTAVIIGTGSATADTITAPWTISQGATATPAVVAAVAGIPTPGFPATATPQALAVVAAVPAVSATGGGGGGGGQVTRGSTQGTDWTLSESSATTSLTATLPTAMATGKALIAQVIGVNTLGLPATGGWSWLAGPYIGQSGALSHGLAVTTDPSAGLAFANGVSSRMTVILVVYSGADSSQFADVAASRATITGTTLTVTGITTVTDGDMLLSGQSMNSSTSTLTQPTGWTLVAKNTSSVGKGGGFADLAQATAGATGNIVWTMGTSGLVQDAYLVALKAAPGGGGGAATPAVVAAVAAVGVPTIRVGALAAPAAVAAVAAVPAVAVTVGALTTPAAVAGTATIPAPSAGGAQNANPATVAAVAGVAAPTVQAGAATTPAAVAAVAVVPAPTVQAGGTVSPVTVAGVAAVPAPAVGAGQSATATPAAVAATVGIGQPARLWVFPSTSGTITGLQPSSTYQVTVRAFDAAGNRSADSPVVQITTAAPDQTATPATISVLSNVATGIGISSTLTPATVAAVATVPAVTITGGASGTATPATLTAVAAVPTPTPAGGQSATATPATIIAVAAVGAPTIRVAATATPATVAAVAAVPTPSVGGSIIRQPATITTVAAVGAPTLHAGATITPATVTATAQVPPPTPAGGQSATATPARIQTSVAIGAAVVSVSAVATPASIAAAAVIGTAVLRYGATVLPTVIAALAAFPPIGPPTLPPRWMEGTTSASDFTEGASSVASWVEGATSL